MIAGLVILGVVLLVIGVILLAKRRPALPEPENEIEDLGRQAVERARRDVETVGWHLLMISGNDDTPGFAFSIGLWRTYKHPEVILFTPTKDPRGKAGYLKNVADRVAQGETFAAGKPYPGFFEKFPGLFREVQPQWYPEFLGTAGGFYESFDFPALQLFWPDGESLFPWESGFAKNLLAFQPLLWEQNVILANVGLAAIQSAQKFSNSPLLPSALGELLVKRDTVNDEILEDWRWLIGPELSLFHVTVFGDLFLKSPAEHIYWLDTGAALLDKMGDSEEEAIATICAHPAVFFHASTLLAARALDWKPGADQVYSWRQPPMLGGKEALDNLDLVSLAVHVSNLGRTAFAIKDLPEGAAISGSDFTPLS